MNEHSIREDIEDVDSWIAFYKANGDVEQEKRFRIERAALVEDLRDLLSDQ